MIALPTATLDLDALRLFRDGTEHALSPQEADILQVLANHHGETVVRETLLTEAMGISPKTVTRALDAAIRRLRAKLEPDPRHPRSLVSVRGRGYRLIRIDDAAPTPRPVIDGVLGREPEIRAALGQLDLNGRVLLLGPGGVGKTTLADHLLGLRPAPSAPARRIDLAEVVAARDLLPTLGLGLGLVSQPTVDRVQLALAHGRAPCLLDNLEQLDPEAMALLREIVDGCDAPLVLTSRQVPWEGLPTVILQGLELEDGVELMLRAARRTGAHLLPDPHALRPLVAGVDALPLALELLGAQLARLGLAALQSAVDGAMIDGLELGDGRTGRHASLSAVVAGSWALLSPEARTALSWWSGMVGAFDLTDAAAVLPPGAPPVLVLLDELTWASLVVLRDDLVHVWVPVRAFAADRSARDQALSQHLLDRCPTSGWYEESVREAHRGWVVARRADLLRALPQHTGADHARMALTLFFVGHSFSVAQRDRMGRSARRAAAEAGHAALEVEAVLVHVSLGHWSRPAAEALDLLDALVPLLPRVPDAGRLQVAYSRGLYLRRCGRMDEALRGHEEGAEQAIGRGLPGVAARMRQEVGVIHRRRGDLDEAARSLHSALSMHRTLGETRCEAGCHLSLASIRRQQMREPEALEHAERAATLARPLERPILLANALNNLANVQAQLGLPEAVASMEASVALSRAQGDRPSLCVSVGGVGMFYDMADRALDAELAYEEARTHAMLAGYHGHVAYWTYRLGDLTHRRGDLSVAERGYQHGIEGLERIDSPDARRARALLAMLLAERGAFDDAQVQLAHAAPLAHGEEDDRLFLAAARAGVARWRGDAEADDAFDGLGVARAGLHRPILFVPRAVFERTLPPPQQARRPDCP